MIPCLAPTIRSSGCIVPNRILSISVTACMDVLVKMLGGTSTISQDVSCCVHARTPLSKHRVTYTITLWISQVFNYQQAGPCWLGWSVLGKWQYLNTKILTLSNFYAVVLYKILFKCIQIFYFIQHGARFPNPGSEDREGPSLTAEIGSRYRDRQGAAPLHWQLSTRGPRQCGENQFQLGGYSSVNWLINS